jgi:hypothetical protein
MPVNAKKPDRRVDVIVFRILILFWGPITLSAAICGVWLAVWYFNQDPDLRVTIQNEHAFAVQVDGEGSSHRVEEHASLTLTVPWSERPYDLVVSAGDRLSSLRIQFDGEPKDITVRLKEGQSR